MASYPLSLLLLLIFTISFNHITAKNRQATVTHHHHHHVQENGPTTSLHRAYIALQAWKHVIYSDPKNFTSNWNGPNVCNYTGIYCAPYPNDTTIRVVAGIDLNHADIAGFLPDELGLLSELALIHLNSNRFCGILPKTLSKLSVLYELDISNNRFVGPFPSVVLSLPSLRYLDLRYNEFEGPLPPELFNKNLDAIFVNNNRFTSMIPPNLGSSTASVVVFANNRFGGCLPKSIAKFAHTLEELLLINTSISGCLPYELGFLYKLKVLDVSFNQIVGPIPYSLAGLSHLERLDLAHNKMSGIVPEGICVLPNLSNFTFSYNFFCEEQGACNNLTSKGIVFDDRRNCLPDKPLQRSKKECEAQKPVDCFEDSCGKPI
ncbi:Ras suppressor protein (contains leucine-rich repeats) [Handroanthus impetiginosus]|uniref:Cell wall hydroxyproline-rich glycoprotein n=1 Tax=Handroanthus impetiginosus TaxID=429701 RepID=A0A2G9HCD7_9LAMI|nr:Ras suppressor protein (contains leucine-rich repeats) [Handroanthus impetiginosus]